MQELFYSSIILSVHFGMKSKIFCLPHRCSAASHYVNGNFYTDQNKWVRFSYTYKQDKGNSIKDNMPCL
jgi:hypothetical protein